MRRLVRPLVGAEHDVLDATGFPEELT